MKTGAERIAEERSRQVNAEGFDAKHDAEHTDGSLAMAAACYAAPSPIFREERRFVNRVEYLDPWPWESTWDRRYRMGSGKRNPGNVLPDPKTYTKAERIDLLAKAGALIAAEIDRLQGTKEPLVCTCSNPRELNPSCPYHAGPPKR